jgi:omega-hydroxy-beta-dihydromenaquinone-9 sulfotransferase
LNVEQPLFIVGTGRCGSTVFHQVLTYHPSVTWLSSLCAGHPDNPGRNRLAMQMFDLSLPASLLRKAIYPGEWYPFWNHYYRGFGGTIRDLVGEDVTPPVKAHIRQTMGAMLSESRPRLLVKITGWPRVGFLKEVFPDAKFVHILRDGRAVANSLLSVRWWPGWGGPQRWTCGELSPSHRAKWEAMDRSYIALAGLEWEILMDAFDRAKRLVPPADYLDIRYEDLCAEPVRWFKAVADFAGLEWSPAFERTVRGFTLDSANYKWQRDLTEPQQVILNDTLGEALKRYGYAQ